jgi:hypothetical protein
VLSVQGGEPRTNDGERGVLSNKGMKLPRVGAGTGLTWRGEAWSKIAAQVMPGVRPTVGLGCGTTATAPE